MEKLCGVEVVFTKDEQPITPEYDGYVGEMTSGQAVITVTVFRGHTFVGIDVDGKKNVVPKKDLSKIEGLKVFQAKIPIKTGGKGGVNHTEYPNNNLRLLEIGLIGRIGLWEISLISQEGYFFLTTQKVYDDTQYCDGDKIFCAPFVKWPQMLSFLAEKMMVQNLQPISEYKSTPQSTNRGLAPNTGHILWFNLAQGFGAITTPKGMARVHWSQIIKEGRLAFLETGDLVLFKYLKKPNQTKKRETAFPREAYVVSPI